MDKKDIENKENTEIPIITLDIEDMEHMCGTSLAYKLLLIFLIVVFGIPAILILFLTYPHITFKEIIISNILLGIMVLGIIYMYYGG